MPWYHRGNTFETGREQVQKARINCVIKWLRLLGNLFRLQYLQSIHTNDFTGDSLWIFLPQAQEEQRKGSKSYKLFARKLEINVLLNSFVWTNETVTYLTPDFYFCSPIVCSYNMQSDPSTEYIRLPVAPFTNLTTVTDCHHIQNKSPSPCHQPIRPVSSGP